MLELYLAIALFGIGSYINKNSKENKSNEIRKEKPKKMEEKKKVDTSLKNSKNVPRNFTQFLDDSTKKLYESGKDTIPISNIVSNSIKQADSDSDSESEGFVESPLTGKKVKVENFLSDDTGKKILPFFGGKIKQNTSETASQLKLACFTGVDADTQFHKKETKPKFKPTKDLAFVNGSPNVTDALKSRYNKSNFKTNERPFKEVRVAPGLNDAKCGVSGKGGFHQFETNEIARSNFKTIDELNVRQQITYTTPVKAGSKISKRTATSQVHRNRPEKAWHQTLANLLKTTGQMIKYAARENFVSEDKGKHNSRQEYGHAIGTVVKPKQIEITQESKRNTYENYGLHNVKINHKWRTDGEQADYGKASFVAGPNERDTTTETRHSSNVASAVKSLSAPLLDLMKVTKKENVIGNSRPEGNMNAQIPKKQTVYDTNDVAKTTIKETLIHNNHEGNIKGPDKLAVYDPNDVAKTTIKETTEDNGHMGNVKIDKPKIRIYDYDTKPKITIRNTLAEVDYNANAVNANTPNKQTVQNQDKLKKTIKETTEDNIHSSNVKYTKDAGYIIDPADAPATQKQYLSDYEYSGNAKNAVNLSRTTHAERNSRLNLNKQSISKGRKPMGSNVKIWNGREVMNVLQKLQMSEVNAERVEKDLVYGKIPSKDGKLFTNMRVGLSNDVQEELINTDILNAYKDNPYTHSLSSYAYS